MKVAELQQLLSKLERLLATAGLRQTSISELALFTAALGRFGDRDLKSFIELLGQVALDGTTTPKETAKKQTTATSSPIDLAALTRRVKEVYEQAAQEWVTDQVVNDLCAQLERKEVTKDSLGTIAAGIEYKVKGSDTKPKVIAAIRNRIIDRMGATIRRQLIERPGGDSGGTTPP